MGMSRKGPPTLIIIIGCGNGHRYRETACDPQGGVDRSLGDGYPDTHDRSLGDGLGVPPGTTDLSATAVRGLVSSRN